MFSYCVSLLSMASYGVADFIRNSSPTWVLVSLGLLFFVLGTFLRRLLPGEKEAANSHTAITRERLMPRKTYGNAFENIAGTHSAAGQDQHLARVRHAGTLIPLNTYVESDEIGNTAVPRKRASKPA